jgi:hypothetical protein
MTTIAAKPVLTDLFVQYTDFQESLNSGRMAFSEIEEEGLVIDEEWIIKNVTQELDVKEFYMFRGRCKLTGTPPMSYLSAIGFVLGYMETELTPDSHFWTGVQEGKEAYQDGLYFPEDDHVWSERDIIAHVSREIDIKLYRRCVRFEMLQGHTPDTYLHVFGFTIGYLDAALVRGLAM